MRALATATDAQRVTVEQLVSRIDNIEIAQDDVIEEDLVFSGDGTDGPECGYVKPDGTVSWITGG